LIYKDKNENLKEEVVTFWTVVERKRQGLPVYQLPNDGAAIITTLHINDMFLLGIKEEEINWENPDYDVLKEQLFKVQTLSSIFYEFRLSTDSTQNKDTNSNVFRRIQSFGDGKTGWRNLNPIKVKISVSGNISKI
jgi:CRISPR-associated endonuclease Csn1